jgi:hypothetical protein
MSEQKPQDEAKTEPEAEAKTEAKAEAKAEAKTEAKAEPKAALPVSIWTWVGMVLSVYGVIITGMGLSYFVNPETQTVTSQYNPSLWWGVLMVLAGATFLVLGWRERSASRR